MTVFHPSDRLIQIDLIMNWHWIDYDETFIGQKICTEIYKNVGIYLKFTINWC